MQIKISFYHDLLVWLYSQKLLQGLFKGIVSRDFEVCFLVPLDSSDIATPDGTGSLKKKCDFVLNF
jgi:hypothetical protein